LDYLFLNLDIKHKFRSFNGKRGEIWRKEAKEAGKGRKACIRERKSDNVKAIEGENGTVGST
jgi:hypothetical protein